MRRLLYLTLLFAAAACLVPPAQAQATFEVVISNEREAVGAEEALTPEVLAQQLRASGQLIHRGGAAADLWVLAWALQGGQVVDGRPLGSPQPVAPGTHAVGEIVSQEHLAGFLQAMGTLLSDAFVREEEAFGAAEVLALPDTSRLSESALQEAMGSMRLPASIVDALPAGEGEVTIVLFAAPFPPILEGGTHHPAAVVLRMP